MILHIGYFITYLAEAFIAWQYLDDFFQSKYKVFTKSVGILLGYMGLLLLFYLNALTLNVFWLNLIPFFLMNCILTRVLFWANLKEACFHSLIMTIVMVITELIVEIAGGWFYKDFFIFQKDTLAFVLLSFLCKLFYYLCMIVIMRLFGRKEKNEVQSSKFTLILCIVPLVSIWVMITLFIICGEGELALELNWLVMVSAILVLGISIAVFWMHDYNQKINQETITLQLQLQNESAKLQYYQMLSKQEENQRIIVHDLKKHLNAISLLNEEGKNENIKKYIDHLLEPTGLGYMVKFCNYPILNVLLNQYMELCNQKNICLDVDIRKDSINFMELEDIVALFGNLLENAVEAAEQMEDAFIELDVIYQELKHTTVVTMVNSCQKQPQKGVNGELISGKKNRLQHGFGMKSINRAANKYKGNVKTYYAKEDQTFHTVVLLTNDKIIK